MDITHIIFEAIFALAGYAACATLSVTIALHWDAIVEALGF